MTNEDDKDEFGEILASNRILSRLPKHMTDTHCRARYVSGAVRKYRAYLDKHPDDGGAWEGLGYFYLRMTGDDIREARIGAGDLDDPEDTDYEMLSYQCNKRALSLRPTSLGLRRSVATHLSNAIAYHGTDASNPGVIGIYGGLNEARRELLSLIDTTLLLLESRPDIWDRERLEWRVDRAVLLCDLKKWADAQIDWLIVKDTIIERILKGKYEWPILADPGFVNRSLFECAFHLGEFLLAESELEQAEAFYKGQDRSLNRERLQLLKATAPPAAIQAFARQQSELALKNYSETPDSYYLLQAAEWFEEAGEVAQAKAALQKILGGTGYDRVTAAEQLERLNNLPPR